MESIEKCETCRCNKICDHNKYGFENCGNYISADVVPRSEYEKAMGVIKEVHRLATEVKADLPLLVKQIKTEVAREIFEEIEREINAALESNYKVLPCIELSEELWERVQGKIDALRGMDGFIAELKKKYTEGRMI